MTEETPAAAAGGPATIEREAWSTVAGLYGSQLLEKFWALDAEITRNAMVALCLTARAFDPGVRYVLLEGSDQGPWQTSAGLASALAEQPGDFAYTNDLDPDLEFDDGGWPSCLTERTEGTWQPFCQVSTSMPGWRFLDVEKVLAEVSVPYRPITPEGQELADRSELAQSLNDRYRLSDAEALRAVGLCGQPTDWPGRPCGLSGGHPGRCYPAGEGGRP